MAIDDLRGEGLRRRDALLAALGLSFAGLSAAAPALRLAASWQAGSQYFVGLLAAAPDGQLRVQSQIEVPTRAHGLVADAGGWLMAVARRPGDWLLRWQPRSGRAHWAWAAPGCSFNGHALRDPKTGRWWATQTESEGGEGWLAVYEGERLNHAADWASAGRDPHAMLLHEGRLWVANGGIPTRPETGRAKLDLSRMDASLAALDASDGALQGQWRLPDVRLSLRHLAAAGSRIGVALQAEHDDDDERQRAPLLAVFEGGVKDGRLQLPAAPEMGGASGGYGGDIARFGDGFVVSGTRAGRVWAWDGARGWFATAALPGAGALAAVGAAVWAGGQSAAGRLQVQGIQPLRLPEGLRLDNHWVPV